jgi:hypothetical protein
MVTGSPAWNADIPSTFATIRHGPIVRGLRRKKAAQDFSATNFSVRTARSSVPYLWIYSPVFSGLSSRLNLLAH